MSIHWPWCSCKEIQKLWFLDSICYQLLLGCLNQITCTARILFAWQQSMWPQCMSTRVDKAGTLRVTRPSLVGLGWGGTNKDTAIFALHRMFSLAPPWFVSSTSLSPKEQAHLFVFSKISSHLRPTLCRLCYQQLPFLLNWGVTTSYN